MMLGFGQLGDTTAGVTAQSLGVPVPSCGGGSAYLDDNGDWQCSAPPSSTATSSGGAGIFLVAAVLAIAAYAYFGTKAAKTYQAFSSGDSKQIFGSLT